MNNHELQVLLKACSSFKQCTKIISCSTELMHLRLDRTVNTVIIANTDLCEGSGIHWVAIYIPRILQGTNILPIVDFFDSLGKNAHEYSTYFSQFLSLHCKLIRNNCIQLQSLNTKTCGGWCINFLERRSKGESMNTYIKSFTKNAYKNDEYIQRYLIKRFAFNENLLS